MSINIFSTYEQKGEKEGNKPCSDKDNTCQSEVVEYTCLRSTKYTAIEKKDTQFDATKSTYLHQLRCKLDLEALPLAKEPN